MRYLTLFSFISASPAIIKAGRWQREAAERGRRAAGSLRRGRDWGARGRDGGGPGQRRGRPGAGAVRGPGERRGRRGGERQGTKREKPRKRTGGEGPG